MDNLPQYQITDAYLMSTLSLLCVFLFIYTKSNAAWSRNKGLKILAAAWTVLELLILTLFALQTNEKIKLSRFPVDSMYGVLMTLSLWGTATLQVSREPFTCNVHTLNSGSFRSLRSSSQLGQALT